MHNIKHKYHSLTYQQQLKIILKEKITIKRQTILEN